MSGRAFVEAAQEILETAGPVRQCDVSLRGGGRQGTVTLPAEGVETVAFHVFSS